MKLLLYAMAGGALGSGARHLVNVGMGRWLGPGFPWWTFVVNVSGCFLMGVLIESLALKFQGSTDLRTLLATGVLGGYTTFSAFSLDFSYLMQRGDHLADGVGVLPGQVPGPVPAAAVADEADLGPVPFVQLQQPVG